MRQKRHTHQAVIGTLSRHCWHGEWQSPAPPDGREKLQ
jgi:hypothetical protein